VSGIRKTDTIELLCLAFFYFAGVKPALRSSS
jgi:hypothetical protein